MSTYPWFDIAKTYIGKSEIKGPKHASFIVRMWERIGLGGIKNDETPWCAAFVGSCLEEAGIRSSRSGLALSYANYGQMLPYAAVGAIAYKRRYNTSGKVVGGHVTFVAGRDKLGRIICLGGNQGDKVSLAPFSKTGIIGYRWPNGYPLPVRAPLPLVEAGKFPVKED